MIYWDTSAIIFTLAQNRLPDIQGFTRPHTLSEFYSRTTGKGFVVIQGGRERIVKLTPELAADRVGKLKEQLQFVSLDAEETAEALRRAAALGVAGGRTHDFLHIAAAEKGRAEKILPCNGRDFAGLSEIALEDPSAQAGT